MSNKNKDKSSLVTGTMQLDDLRLDPPENEQSCPQSNPANESDQDQLIGQVSELIEEREACESPDHSADAALQHVDAISRRIEALTQSLKLSGDPCQCEETSRRIIEIDARLEQLHQQVRQQAARGDKLVASLQLIESIGTQLDALPDQVQQAARESQPDLAQNLQPLQQGVEDLSSRLRQIEERPDPAERLDKQSENLTEIGLQLEQLAQQGNQTQWREELVGKLDAIQAKLDQTGDLDHIRSRLDEMQVGIQQIDLQSLAEKLDAIAAHADNHERLAALEEKVGRVTEALQKLEGLAELPGQVEAIGQSAQHSEQLHALENQLNSLQESLHSHEGLQHLARQVEILSDLVQTRATENESRDNSRFDELTEQVRGIGQALADRESGQADAGHIDQLAEKLHSLVELLEQKANFGGEGSGLLRLDDNVCRLIERFDSFESNVNENGGVEVFDHGSSEQMQDLTGKLEAFARLLENREDLPAAGDGGVDYDSRLQDMSDKLEQTRQSVDSLVNSMVPLLENLHGERPEEQTPDGLGNWEQQKRAILQGYGINTDDEPDLPLTEEASEFEKFEENVPVAEVVAEPAEVSTPELDELRVQLEEKLRRAEVEISIERAKIHQERRELEELQSELSREKAKIETQNSKASDDDEDDDSKQGTGGRWSRFLGS
jgi:DNA repair exonuclease SbcCD ATPase subunit